MLKFFWLVPVLVGVLWFKNTRYAIKQYLADRNYALFAFYMGLLLGLGYLLVYMTNQVMTLTQSSQDVLANL
jgi:hypothetical protein